MPKKSGIYTKGGDQGKTSLLGGTRVLKSHDRLEAYGNLDELNSFIGLIRDQEINVHYREILIRIQSNLMTMESLIARDPDKQIHDLPVLKEEDITLLEEEIDSMDMELSPLRSFILPGGNIAVSNCHIARTVCRRAERSVVRLDWNQPVEGIIIRYLNRLSDYLFVLARKIAKDMSAEEKMWNKGKDFT